MATAAAATTAEAATSETSAIPNSEPGVGEGGRDGKTGLWPVTVGLRIPLFSILKREIFLGLIPFLSLRTIHRHWRFPSFSLLPSSFSSCSIYVVVHLYVDSSSFDPVLSAMRTHTTTPLVSHPLRFHLPFALLSYSTTFCLSLFISVFCPVSFHCAIPVSSETLGHVYKALPVSLAFITRYKIARSGSPILLLAAYSENYTYTFRTRRCRTIYIVYVYTYWQTLRMSDHGGLGISSNIVLSLRDLTVILE